MHAMAMSSKHMVLWPLLQVQSDKPSLTQQPKSLWVCGGIA